MTTMTEKTSSRFVYVTYIRTTVQGLWAALTVPEMVPQYWLGFRINADWKVGGAWKLCSPDGRTTDAGEIIEYEPSKRVALRWRHQSNPELRDEGDASCTIEIEAASAGVKLTVTHSMERENSKLIAAVRGAWPQILSNLKSLLETGTAVLPARAA